MQLKCTFLAVLWEGRNYVVVVNVSLLPSVYII